MTVEVTTSTATRFGNGVTQVFDFGFRVQTAESVKVYSVVDSVKVPLAPGTYVVSINSNGVGGLVTITPAPLAGVRLLISRETNVTQEVSVSAQTRYDPAVAEFVWDKLTMLMQELLLVAAPSEANLLGEFLGPWATAQDYVVGDRVFEGVSGNGYQCILAHTSGVFADDLAALRWSIYVQRGASGTGTGDMLAAQNLNDLVDKTASRNNLGVTLANLAVTASAAELNLLDGVTKTTAMLNAQLGDDRIINGAFDMWQRGASGTANGYTAADRWANFFTGGTVTQSRQAQTVGTLFGANNPAFFVRQTVSGQSLASHGANTTQRMEGVRTYAGQTVTIMGWAKRGSGTGNMAVELSQNFGTGGSPSAQVVGIGATQVSLTGSWAPFAIVIAVPSISGKTLGTDGNSFLGLQFWSSAGSDFAANAASLGIQTIGVDLWGIHIRVGTFTTADVAAYVAPSVEDTLRQCQRYYEQFYGHVVSYAPVTGALAGHGINFAVTKRAVPSVGLIVATENVNTAAVYPSPISPFGLRYYVESAAAGGVVYTALYGASAEL